MRYIWLFYNVSVMQYFCNGPQLRLDRNPNFNETIGIKLSFEVQLINAMLKNNWRITYKYISLCSPGMVSGYLYFEILNMIWVLHSFGLEKVKNYKNPTIFNTICWMAGSMGRWEKWLIDQASDDPRTFFHN